ERRPGRISRAGMGAAQARRHGRRRGHLALPDLFAPGMGAAARRHADDPLGRRDRAPAVPQRPGRARGGGRDLSAAVAPAGAVRCRDPGPVSRHAAFPAGRERGQGALHHRGRGLGRGRKIDHRAGPDGAARALGQRPEGRPHHHGRLSVAERRARAARPHGAQGLSGKLRHRQAPALSRRHQGRQAPCPRPALLASRL
ncbi:MAG: Pantothenate kinase, partial [uncultured Microvirga sp.]